MGKYEEAYLRTMTLSDFKNEPADEIAGLVIEHINALGDITLSQKAIKKYSRVFFQKYTKKQLVEFLSIVKRSSNIFDCINADDPKFLIQFKCRVMTKGDDILRDVVSGIVYGYGGRVVRQVVMFAWAYLKVFNVDTRILADFFSGIDELTDNQVIDCTDYFMTVDWSTEKLVGYLANNITLCMLYYKHTGNYSMYVKCRVKSVLHKKYDDFDPRQLPIVSSNYKPDWGLLRI